MNKKKGRKPLSYFLMTMRLNIGEIAPYTDSMLSFQAYAKRIIL
jgi:hypothetical protein